MIMGVPMAAFENIRFKVVGSDTIHYSLQRATNIQWQSVDIQSSARAALKGQTAKCIWLTGLSGSGKSTIANLLDKRLYAEGKHTYILDGDNLRYGLNSDLGFSKADRAENIRRVAAVAKLMVDAGLIVIVSFISPFESERRMARHLFADGEFVEVFVDAPLATCERRDVKGLYQKARLGMLKDFTGIDSPYEPPTAPEVHALTDDFSPEQCAQMIVDVL